MDPDVVISAEGIGKRYRLGQSSPYATLRDALSGAARRARRSGTAPEKDLWALKDVSFEVRRGEALGIIGRNGAGKSTLLKILSRITDPTVGYVDLRGRVGSLLEVGTGFHPELTGRENIFLNGAILGLSRRDIAGLFDEIVAFAEIDRFIDTPVKRYSSGMYTRLAFAVAAHLQPEILIVDEVLAVGDLSFQAKCLGKMDEVSRHGRTILFVSHSMQSIQTLCQRALLLEHGQIEREGNATDVVAEYRRRTAKRAGKGLPLAERTDRAGTGEARVHNLVVRDADLQPTPWIATDQPCYVDVHYHATEAVDNVQPGIGFDTPGGQRALTLFGDFTGDAFNLPAGDGVLRCRIDHMNVRPDRYAIAAFLGNRHGAFDVIQDAAEIEVADEAYYHTGHYPDDSQSPMLQHHAWSHVGAADVTHRTNTLRHVQLERERP